MAKVSKRDKQLGKEVIEVILQSAIAGGHLSLAGKTEAQIDVEARAYLKNFGMDSGKYLWGTDHRQGLLKEARAYVKKKHWELATLLYATYFEHMLNALIAGAVRRKKFKEDMSVQILRKAQVADKTGWLWELLHDEAMNKEHRNRIAAICEQRNGFVHFKWNVWRAEYQSEAMSPALEKVEKTVRYLRRCEDRIVYRGERKHVTRFKRTL